MDIDVLVILSFIIIGCFRIFAKEEEEIAAYNRKMDNVLDKAIKESLIQVLSI